MKRGNFNYQGFSLGFFLLLILTGCNGFVETPVNTSISMTPTQAQTIKLPTLLPTPTSTSRSTSTSLPTMTSMPALTPVPSPTQLPTLPPEQVQALILDLLKNNGGCKLPCWWGITPGKTTWQEAQSFLETFASEISTRESFDHRTLYAAAFFDSIPEGISLGSRIVISLTAPGGVIQSMNIGGFELSTSFLLPILLSTYGQPEEVWLHTFSSYPDNKLPLSVFVIYQRQGIFAHYWTEGELTGDMIRGCVQSSPRLALWFPRGEITIQEAMEMAALDIPDPILRLSDATNLDEKKFYELFKDVNNLPCLETSKMLWPGLYGETPSP
jgi:hypothetical protein